MVTLQDFIHALETLNLFVKDDKTHSVRLTTVKVLFERQHQGIPSTASKVKVQGEKLSSSRETLHGYLRMSFLLRIFNQIVAFQELLCKIMLLVSLSCHESFSKENEKTERAAHFLQISLSSLCN